MRHRLITIATALLAGLALASGAEAQFIGPSGGSGSGGDIVGPGSSTDNAIARFDGTTGKLLKDTSGGRISNNFALTLAGATITANEPLLNLSQTWNNAGTVFTGMLLNVTNTASNINSLLFDYQVNNISVANLSRSGSITLGGAIFATFGSFTNNVVLNSNTTGVYWGTAGDLALMRDAANTLALRNGTNAQNFRLYETFTDASNYSRMFFSYNTPGSQFEIGSVAAGTGTTRPLGFVVGLSTRWTINTSGHFLAGADNTYDIGASGATRPRNLYLGSALTLAGNIIAASGSDIIFTGRAQISATASGVIRLIDSAGTSFDRLQLGGTAATFPAAKRFGNALAIRQADDTVGAFAALTACASGGEGALAVVTDSSTATWGATVTGGGANRVLAYCNGTNWTVVAI